MKQSNYESTKEVERLLVHIPESWQRLVSVIRHQAAAGHFIFIEGPHTSGKSTFAQILQSKLTLMDDLESHYYKLHPLVTTQQVLTEVPHNSELIPVVILDDADEADAAVIEELIGSNINCFFVILAEPELVNRVPRLQNSRFNLPLFNKEDCHKLLSKMYQSIDSSIDIPMLDSELVYYESKGFPGEVIKLGHKLSAKLERKTSGSMSFDLANKGIFSSLVIGLGLVIFLLYLFFSSSVEKTEVNPIDSTKELTIQTESEAETEVVSEDVITGDLLISKPEESKPKTFRDWLELQNAEHYSIQLYSNIIKAQADSFKEELDLADSYIYSAKVNEQVVYRVVWGVYPNRARAQLALQSLPESILQQKPWLRSFKSIKQEIIETP